MLQPLCMEQFYSAPAADTVVQQLLPGPEAAPLPEPPDPKTCSPREYLEYYIFPVLLPGLAELLHQAKKEKCFEVRCDKEVQELRQWQKQFREEEHISERVEEFWTEQEDKVVLRNKTHSGTLIMSDKRKQCLAETPGMSLQLLCKLVACLAESANGKYDTGPKLSNFTGLW
ncbi:IQ domain-containing protein K [Anas platyrhynchos]|uniref:IQ domain-containing protein K n=1 Tax=Anas platyrhynchos TaxID=8839 RepID=R0LK22_ANAPL|nr:IQ domain-containing protein K [Anas platyrhynchos]